MGRNVKIYPNVINLIFPMDIINQNFGKYMIDNNWFQINNKVDYDSFEDDDDEGVDSLHNYLAQNMNKNRDYDPEKYKLYFQPFFREKIYSNNTNFKIYQKKKDKRIELFSRIL